MKPLPESQIAPAIADALELLAAAKNSLTSAVSYTQYKCEHRFVSEMPWTTIQPAHRICNHCRLVERGSHWSNGSVWSKHDHSKSDLGNVEGRIVVSISSDLFRKMRVFA